MFRFLVAATCLALASAFGSSVSGFGGSVLMSGAQNGVTMLMKKGKSNVPPNMRGQVKKQEEMQAQRAQMQAASKQGEDGLPVFNLFVRSPRANMWYPCGSFKGDNQSKGLCENYSSGGMFAGMAKKQLDSGIAGTLHRDFERLTGTVIRVYPQFKVCKNDLEFGYKLAFDGIPADAPITFVKPEENKGFLDNIKNAFS